MGAIAIIPARYASTRLPGKPLLSETGRPLIQHVAEAAARASRVDRVVVATDDRRILQAVEAFGGEAMMTSADHACGTDRIAEAAARLALPEGQIVLNVQGDEPDIRPDCLDKLVDFMEAAGAPMATLAALLPAERADDPNKVKVVLAADSTALYFSRARIPHQRDDRAARTHETEEARYLLHLGTYAYRAGFLRLFATLSPTPAERTEKLEQLRALEHGYKIAVVVVDYSGVGIDTLEDYAEFVARYRKARR